MKTVHLGTAIFLAVAMTLKIIDNPAYNTWELVGWVYFICIGLAFNVNKWLDGRT